MKVRKLSCCFKNLLTPFQVSSRAAFKMHTSQHEPRIDELKWFKNGILAEERAILQNLSICKIQADKENRFNFPNAGSVSLLHYKRLSSTTLRHHSVLFVFQPPASFFFTIFISSLGISRFCLLGTISSRFPVFPVAFGGSLQIGTKSAAAAHLTRATKRTLVG